MHQYGGLPLRHFYATALPSIRLFEIYRKATEEFRDFALIPRASAVFRRGFGGGFLPPLHSSPLYLIVRIDSKNNRWRDKGCCG